LDIWLRSPKQILSLRSRLEIGYGDYTMNLPRERKIQLIRKAANLLHDLKGSYALLGKLHVRLPR